MGQAYIHIYSALFTHILPRIIPQINSSFSIQLSLHFSLYCIFLSMVSVEDHEKVSSGRQVAQTGDLDVRIRASEAAHRETHMSPWQGIKLYPKAIAFSVVVSSCIIMEDYDVNLLQGLFAFSLFQKRYGQKQSEGPYQLSAAWQFGLTNDASVGEILGLFLNGILAENFGYRRTLLGGLFFLTGFIFILFFAPSVIVLQIGEILCGVPWGTFQTLTTVYASEVCPFNVSN
jgi:SP family general alpha glucoside:H+ symporter-like MFS transporter